VDPRALACAAALLLAAACRTAGGPRPAAPEVPPPGPGPELAAPVAGRFAPGLEALQQAVTAGDDELARALIAHEDSLGPDERVWQTLRAFERILDGRAAVKCLKLELACLPEPPGSAPPDAVPGAQAGRLVLRAANSGTDEIELRPGPATLRTARTDLSRRGTEANAEESRPFDKLRRLVLAPGASTEIELARYFLAPPPGQLAVRLSFELELRSGTVLRGGRELPAMHFAVAPARAMRHAPELPDEVLTPAQLLAASAGVSTAEELLALAVRTEPQGSGAELAALERELAELPRPRLELWILPLRWLAGSDAPTDVDRLRDWLRGRERARATKEPRPQLVLPRAAPVDGN
jgi:hypothetical protein